MADIFVSYAAEDRDRARDLAHALENRGWTVWWDREIPLGRPFDEVIEQALARARCVIVLWSRASVGSEWVRSEASEARRRGILVPVFLESVEPPLAFRLLQGGDLTAWQPGASHEDFEHLATRVGELLAHTTPAPPADGRPVSHDSSGRVRRDVGRSWWAAALVGALAVVVVGIAMTRALRPDVRTPGTVSKSPGTEQGNQAIPAPPSRQPAAGDAPVKPVADESDSLALALQNALGTSGAQPALGATTAFELKEIAVHIAFVSKEQARAFQSLGLSEGAVVIFVGPGPAQEAGLQAADVITAIGGAGIDTAQDLRTALRRVGPGKTRYTVRRGGQMLSLDIDCPGCTAP
jgi:hypothetical protein